jgi:undecaprenyl-phosphate 4-deoxy-4-formamido-L-arabinose transferase
MVPSLSVVVPVYNGATTLPALVQRLEAVLVELGADYEILLVNDGSNDASWATIESLAAEHAAVRGIDLMRNYGQHNALLAGIRVARKPLVVTLDDDLQNPPEEIPKLLARLDEGNDVVYGAWRVPAHGLLRNLATKVTKFALRGVIGGGVAGQVSAFRAFRTDLRDAFADFAGPYVSIDVLLSWGTTRFAATPVRHDPRAAGQSSYGIARLATHALNVLTGFSTRPLRLATLVGLVFTLLGAVILVLVLVRFFVNGRVVPGFAFLASIIAIFSGAQLLTLGIIGEYLARMHVRIMDRPPYAVREET